VNPEAGPRPRLLAAAVDYVATHGAADLTLRKLAAALGTSHRMLLYHFGSKEGLLVEVIGVVEQQQRDALREVARFRDTTHGVDQAAVAMQFWERLADPALAPNERLFFEMYGRALQGDPAAAPMLDGIVEDWIGPQVELYVRWGMPTDQARATARLGLAVARGLLLDLLATGDRAGVDDAMRLFLDKYADARTPNGLPT
jgi:AcrR family transcriptional regulator